MRPSARGEMPSSAVRARGRLGAQGRRLGDAPAQQQRERHHRAEDRDRDGQIGRAPALGRDDPAQKEGPDRARDIVPGRDDRHRDAAPALEPVRDVGHERPERRRRAYPDHEVQHREGPEVRRARREAEAERHRHCGRHQRARHPEAVDRAPDQQVAGRKAEHGEGIGQRRRGPVGPELGLDRGHDEDVGPQPHIAEDRDRQRRAEARPGIAAVVDLGAHGRMLRGGAPLARGRANSPCPRRH